MPESGEPPVELSPPLQRLIVHWGEMGSRWGVNRTVSQVHALLFLAGRPLDAEEIAAALQVARSNVSTSLRELAAWKLVRSARNIGDRRDRYETPHDPWELFRVIVRERKGREFDPTIAALRETLADPALARDDPAAHARVRETLLLMESLAAWSDEMLKLERRTLVRLMKTGARVGELLQRTSRRKE